MRVDSENPRGTEMVGDEVRSRASDGHSKFIVDTWAVQIFRDCGAAAVEITNHISPVVNELGCSANAACSLHPPTEGVIAVGNRHSACLTRLLQPVFIVPSVSPASSGDENRRKSSWWCDSAHPTNLQFVDEAMEGQSINEVGG